MKDSSEFWSTGYNKQAMCRLVMQDRSLPRQNGVESAIDAYRKRLGSDLDASFFQNIPNMQFATNKDGSTVSQLISSDGILLQQNKQFYETEGVHAGDRHNEFTTYYESGSPEREIPYVNGQKHGTVKTYHENGHLWQETSYVNGQIHGMVKTYDQNGHLGQEIPYVNGQIHGMVKTYHENGRLKEETPYVNGQKHGTRKTYHENGQLMEEIPYIHGARQTQSPSETAPGSLKKTLSSAESVNDQLSVEKESGADGKINHAPKETLQPPQSPSETEPGSLKKTLSSAAQTKKPSTFELKKLVAQNLRR